MNKAISVYVLGDNVILLTDLSAKTLSLHEAEGLLSDLHSVVMTMRGLNKPLRLRDRVRGTLKAVRGR